MANSNSSNNKLLIFLFYLAFIFIGADKFAFSIGGFTLRISQFLFLIISFILIIKLKYKIHLKLFLIFLPFFIFHVISLLISINFNRSLAYTIWLSLNFLIILVPISISINLIEIEKIYFNIFEIYGITTIIQFFVGLFGIEIPGLYTNFYMGLPRPAVWFYEPSFLATFMVIYFAITLYKSIYTGSKSMFKRLFRAFIYILFTTSISGIVGILIAVISLLLFTKLLSVKKKIIFISVIAILGFISLFSIYLINKDLFFIVFGRVFSLGITTASGIRITGLSETLNVIKEYPHFGIGPGAYVNLFGYPPTNVTLELIVSIGIWGSILGIIWFISPFYFGKKIKNDENLKAYLFAYWTFIITLQINQNYLRLYHWQLMGIIFGFYFTANKKNIRIDNEDSN